MGLNGFVILKHTSVAMQNLSTFTEALTHEIGHVLGLAHSSEVATNDTVLTSKVKATFVDAADLQSNAFKVVTERGTVYMMGRVTQREAGRATDIARSIGSTGKLFPLIGIHEMSASLKDRYSTAPVRRPNWPAEPNSRCRRSK